MVQLRHANIVQFFALVELPAQAGRLHVVPLQLRVPLAQQREVVGKVVLEPFKLLLLQLQLGGQVLVAQPVKLDDVVQACAERREATIDLRDPAALRDGGVGDQTHQCFDNLFAVLADLFVLPWLVLNFLSVKES